LKEDPKDYKASWNPSEIHSYIIEEEECSSAADFFIGVLNLEF